MQLNNQKIEVKQRIDDFLEKQLFFMFFRGA